MPVDYRTESMTRDQNVITGYAWNAEHRGRASTTFRATHLSCPNLQLLYNHVTTRKTSKKIGLFSADEDTVAAAKADQLFSRVWAREPEVRATILRSEGSCRARSDLCELVASMSERCGAAENGALFVLLYFKRIRPRKHVELVRSE